MPDHPFCESVKVAKKFFDTSTSCFTEADSNFKPKDEMYTVAQQVAHTAQTLDWFVDGMFKADGFSMNFEALDQEVRKVTSLTDARKWFDRAVVAALVVLEKKTMAEFLQPMAGEIMKGLPRAAAIDGITDHTAHHRGALTVYARLLGKVPTMPYM